MNISNNTKEYAIEKVQQLERNYQLNKIEITLDTADDGYRVKVMAWPKNKNIVSGTSVVRDWFSAIDHACEEVETKIRCSKNKIIDPRQCQKIKPVAVGRVNGKEGVNGKDRDSYEDIVHDFASPYADFRELGTLGSHSIFSPDPDWSLPLVYRG